MLWDPLAEITWGRRQDDIKAIILVEIRDFHKGSVQNSGRVDVDLLAVDPNLVLS
jgi:hypothetical protein